MAIYKPFEQFLFDNDTCFLSGAPLQSSEEKIQVFPSWLMQRYDLEEKPFKLLDESITTYKGLKIPCSVHTAQKLEGIESTIQEAFIAGFSAVKMLDERILFQWIGKLVYGIVFNEIQAGIRQQLMSGEAMNFSQALAKKFAYLHTMLQSLIKPVTFEGSMPFSIQVFEINTEADHFSYRDEINTLVFSLRMKNFGIVACLQDNGANNTYNTDKLKPAYHQQLHPIQFEEVCARYFYSAYLFNRLPEYTILPTNDMIYIEPMPLQGMDTRPIFDPFQVKIYGQVLENFWRPWGFTLFEIIKDPENPMTFLTDAHGNFRTSDSISLPDKAVNG